MRDVIGSGWLLVVLAVLATARATHFVTEDYLFDGPRAFIQRHSGPKIAYLVQCPWCLSIWLGLGIAATAYWGRSHWWVQVPLLGLAASYVTGMLEQASGLINAEHELADNERADADA